MALLFWALAFLLNDRRLQDEKWHWLRTVALVILMVLLSRDSVHCTLILIIYCLCGYVRYVLASVWCVARRLGLLCPLVKTRIWVRNVAIEFLQCVGFHALGKLWQYFRSLENLADFLRTCTFSCLNPFEF